LCQSGSAGLHGQLNRVLQGAEFEGLSVSDFAVQTIGDHRQLIGGGRLVDAVEISHHAMIRTS
jgi:hypothetical protein